MWYYCTMLPSGQLGIISIPEEAEYLEYRLRKTMWARGRDADCQDVFDPVLMTQEWSAESHPGHTAITCRMITEADMPPGGSLINREKNTDRERWYDDGERIAVRPAAVPSGLPQEV